MGRSLLFLVFPAMAVFVLADDFPYHQPPKPVSDVLNAPGLPTVSVSPQRDYAVFMQPVRYPPVSEVAQPMLRLAGIRIDVNTNGPHLAAYSVSFTMKKLPGGEDVHLVLPRDAKLGAPVWSPDSKQFAFTNTTARGIELWIATSATGETRRIASAAVNAVRVNGTPIQWLGDNRTLIVSMVPAGRGAPPADPAIPKGPHVQESLGNAGPAPTYEDLLSTPHDEDLFDYYATAQLFYVDAPTGKLTPFGKPGIYTTTQTSPDGKYVLVGRLHRPYSYQLPGSDFPQDVEVWDRSAKAEYTLASLPLADHIPLALRSHGPTLLSMAPG